jgi:hypothetical protein
MIFYFVRITRYVLLLGACFVLCVTQPPQSSFNPRLLRCCITIATDHMTSHNRYISKRHHVCTFECNFLPACDVSFHSHTPRIQSKPKTLSRQHFQFCTLPKFQAMYRLGHDFLTCNITGQPLQYTVRADMWPSIHNYIIIIIKTATCFHYKLANIRLFMWEEITYL